MTVAFTMIKRKLNCERERLTLHVLGDNLGISQTTFFFFQIKFIPQSRARRVDIADAQVVQQQCLNC